MLIYEKFGYNKIESRYIHEIISKENIKYNENYFNKEHLDVNNLIGGMKSRKILENSSEEVVDVKFVYMGHKIIFQKINYGDQIHYSLNTIDKKNECLVIILSENENKTMCADIHQISMYKNCPIVGKMYNGGGTLLLKIAIELKLYKEVNYEIQRTFAKSF